MKSELNIYPIISAVITILIIAFETTSFSAQCNNATLFPSNNIFVQIGENILSNTQPPGSYNLSFGYEQGSLCTFSSSLNTDFITLRQNGSNAVISSGLSPLTITYDASYGMIEMHINSNTNCGEDGGVRGASVSVNYGIYKGSIGGGYVEDVFDQGPNPTVDLYKGGIGQGFAHIFIEQGDNPPLAIYEGGIGQGYLETLLDQGENPVSDVYKGGIGQGFSHLFIEQGDNPPLSIYEGGIGQGYLETLLDQGDNPLVDLYKGGIDDGWDIVDYNRCSEYLTEWTGSQDVNWHNFQNWICGYRPVITSDVTIPSNVLHMPKVFFNDEIRSLNIKSNASIFIESPVIFKLNGQ